MADRTSLRFLGLIFGGVTVAVMLMAATVVFANVDGQTARGSAPAPIVIGIY